MILVIGGLAAGKRAYVRKAFGYGESDFSSQIGDSAPVLYDLQDISNANLEELLQKEVVICNEVGAGLVPVDPQERARREAVGRLCVTLAQHATSVVRVFCGIGTVIK